MRDIPCKYTSKVDEAEALCNTALVKLFLPSEKVTAPTIPNFEVKCSTSVDNIMCDLE